MQKRSRLIAVPLIAGTIVALTASSGWAFTQQTLLPNGNYDFNYGPLDNKYKSDNGTAKSDPNSPGFHFSVEPGQTGASGFRSFGGDSNAKPPDYSRPLGNGD
jgi:hypothetical protein